MAVMRFAHSAILCLTSITAVTSAHIPEEDACHRKINKESLKTHTILLYEYSRVALDICVNGDADKSPIACSSKVYLAPGIRLVTSKLSCHRGSMVSKKDEELLGLGGLGAPEGDDEVLPVLPDMRT